MRTKVLLVAAATAAVGIASVLADPVYSVNVVGFINQTIPAHGLALLANQLTGTNNLLGTIIPTFVDNGTLYKWDSANQKYQVFQYSVDIPGWFDSSSGDLANPDLSPGQGFFLQNASASPYVLTFVGEVPQGSNSVSFHAAGFTLTGSIPPLAGTVTTLSVPVRDNNTIYKWNVPGQHWAIFQYSVDIPGWFDSASGDVADPALAVGEGFFYLNTPGSDLNWSQSFTVQ